MSPEANTNWQAKVAQYLRDGYGVEDIALKMKCEVSAVRHEVKILRDEGRLGAALGVRG
jgi:DNA-binding NarL/FixJ family response regulator